MIAIYFCLVIVKRSWDGDGASVASNKSDNDLLFNVSMQLGLFTLW